MGISDERKKEKGTEVIFEVIIIKDFPNLMSDTKPHIQEGQRKTNRIDALKLTLRNIFKLWKNQRVKKKLQQMPEEQNI